MLTNAGGDDDEDEDDEDSASESDEDVDDDEKGVKKPKKGATAGKPGIYVPPKIKPVYYDGDEKPEDKEKKLLERAKKRAITYDLENFCCQSIYLEWFFSFFQFLHDARFKRRIFGCSYRNLFWLSCPTDIV